MEENYIDTSEFQFKGKHAEYVSALTNELDTRTKFKIFQRNIDVLIFSSIIGFLYNRKSDVDNTSSKVVKINFQQLVREQNILQYNYELLMLLNKKEEVNLDERLDKAFRYHNDKSDKSQDSQKEYIKYVLGGVEILYEKILEKAVTTDDYIDNLYSFIEEINDRYNKNINTDELFNMCNKARENQN